MIRLGAVLACAAVVAIAPVARAEFPDHPIHILVGSAPGGGTDFIARLIAQKFTDRVGQAMVVVSRPSANGTLATSFVAHAAPDGYNIVEISGNHTTPPIGYKLDYDPVKSFAPITEVGFVPLDLVVHPSVPVNSLAELIAYGKANPGKLNLGDTGPGSTAYWASAMLMNQTGMQITHVPFTGGGPALVALLGGEIQLTFSPMSTSLPNVNAGKLKALAITGAARAPLMPAVPTFAELGLKGFEEVGELAGILAPAGTPEPVVKRLHDEIVAIINSPDFQDAMKKRGLTTVGNTPEEFTEFLKEDMARWAGMQAVSGDK